MELRDRSRGLCGWSGPSGVASGATALIAVLGEPKEAIANNPVVRQTTVKLGDQSVTVLTLHKGDHPAVTATSDKIVVGKQTLVVVDGHFVLGTFEAK